MIKLTVDASVLAKLKLAMPMTDKAERALEKYVDVLERMLDNALLNADDNRYRFFKHFMISVHELMLATGQVRISRKKTYLHKWLEDNNLALITVVERGLRNHAVSVVKLTSLVSLTDTTNTKTLASKSAAQLESYLNDKSLGDQDFFERIHPDFLSLNSKTVRDHYDVCEIDIKSLKQYIFWLVHKANKFNAVQKEKNLRHAETILRIAQFTNGLLPQHKNHSHFGRNYYHGLSVQSVHTSLREAMLGKCVSYDIASSVISWKMGFAEKCFEASKSVRKFDEEFGASLAYLEDKANFTRYIKDETFGDDIGGSDEYKTIKIKEALTALSFGARIYQNGWIDQSGNVFSPALVEIIKNPIARSRFINCDLIKQFREEQKTLEGFIYEYFTKMDKALLTYTELQTSLGRTSKSKVMAYLYQHAETLVMDVVRKELKKRGIAVLASIHDAIITRTKLSAYDKGKIEQRMRDFSGIAYWNLKEEHIKRYVGISEEVKRDELAHKKLIAEQTRLAQGYQRKHF